MLLLDLVGVVFTTTVNLVVVIHVILWMVCTVVCVGGVVRFVFSQNIGRHK